MPCPSHDPVLLRPSYREKLWGGDRITRRFRRRIPMSRCGESWEISTRPEGPSRIENGRFASQTLADFWQHVPAARGPFPLLFKLIDAHQPLSVQVHPGMATAARLGGEAKNEMWYVLEADPDACVYAGFLPGVTVETLRAALENGTLEAVLQRIPVRAGQAISMPGGCVHAIGAGCLLYEVQQNADTTYRLYDWDRRAPDGRPRELHIATALRAIDWTLPAPRVVEAVAATGGANACAVTPILETPFFRFRRHRLSGGQTLCLDASMWALFTERGACRLGWDASTVELPEGRSALVAPGPGRREIHALDPETIVLSTTPGGRPPLNGS